MPVHHLECSECATPFSPAGLRTVCERCGMPLLVRYRFPPSFSRERLTGRPFGLWRYRELLPTGEDVEPVTLGEGGTPLLEVPRLARELSLPRLLVKDEGINPTGSFKARGMSVAVTMARTLGAQALAAPSAGNAGGALAAYGARAGLPVQIAMPRDVPAANRIEAETCGAHVELVDGTIADCGRWIAERARDRGWFDVSTLKEPYRVEGKKTLGLELFEQLGGELPDAILYPTGGGTGLVGMAKAFEELADLGWVAPESAAPRFYAVQSSGCAPVVDGFRAGGEEVVLPEAPATVAAGLRVPAPIGGRWMLRVLRASQGGAIAVTDAELVAGSRLLARTEGIFATPEAGALVAALPHLVESGEIAAHERVVLFLTGCGNKLTEAFE